MSSYFSDREAGPRPRVRDHIDAASWGGIVALIERLINRGAFGRSFPESCPDGLGTYGTNRRLMCLALRAEIPAIPWPLSEQSLPSTLSALDLVEFCHKHVAKAVLGDFHPFYSHYHLTFDVDRGRNTFRKNINRILSRNGLAFELRSNGEIVRLAPPVLRESLTSAVFASGDAELNAMLEAARAKFLDPDAGVRRESLEKLWDAWERLKTIPRGKDKKSSITTLLEQASAEPGLRERLNREAVELTQIGNQFLIRHSEMSQTPIRENDHVDYLFHRLFALIWLLLNCRRR